MFFFVDFVLKINISSIDLDDDLFDSTELNDKQGNIEYVNYFRTHSLQNVQDNYEKFEWETKENYLKVF